MQEITINNSLPKQTGTGGKGTRKRCLGVNLASLMTGVSAFCICAGLFLLGTLDGSGESDDPLQRVGLAMVFIPVLVLGFALKPYEKSN